MGIKGVRQVRRETPESMLRFADDLEAVAKKLRNIAQRMQLKRVYSIEVRYSPGAHTQLLEAIRPFADDAEKKAAKRGA